MVAAATGHEPTSGRQVTEAFLATSARSVIDIVQGSRATWQVWHVRAEAERQVRAAGVAVMNTDAAVEQIVSRALSPGMSIRLGVDDAIDDPALLKRADGASVYLVAGSRQYTSQAIVDAERSLLAAARQRDGTAISDTQVSLALAESAANGLALNPAQAQMVRELATSGARVQVAIAPAGSGKTTAMRVLARAWTDSGGEVIGLAPSARAAAELRTAIETRSDTLAKLTWSLNSGAAPRWVRDIGPQTMVIVDEAGMAGTADLAQAVTYITGKGGSVRLVGDDQQLASIAAGGVLRDIAEQVGVVTLSELQRFTDPAEGAATLALRLGNPAGLGFYLDNGRVHVGDATTTADLAYEAWSTDRAAGLDAVMLAPTRDLVAALNARARDDRLAADGSGGAEVALSDGNRASTGDTVVTRMNNRQLVISGSDWVKNGDRWRVEQVRSGGAVVAVHLDTNRKLTLPAAYVRDHVELGYASTVHGAQGITADTCHTVASGEENRQMFYVAMTRGRLSNDVYLVTASDGDEHNIIKPEALLPPTATDILVGILERDEAQRSAASVARQLADPALLLHEAASRYTDALGFAAEHVVGAETLAAVDVAAELLRPGLTNAPAYPTMRVHLALLAVDGSDPIALLSDVAGPGARELDTARDPAAVIDWRLNPGSGSGSERGPLPWLPGVPDALVSDPRWGDYLTARGERVAELAAQLTSRSAEWTPADAPEWAVRLLEGQHETLRADLAVWRAANGVATHDRRPTGIPQLSAAAGRYQSRLDDRATEVLGDRAAAALAWAPLVNRVDPRIAKDAYWPELADRLSAIDRAGIDVRGMLIAVATTAPLPDDQAAAALRWRLERLVNLGITDDGDVTRNENTQLPPEDRWRDLVDSINPRLTADVCWPALAATLHRAAASGMDLWQELPRILDEGGPLPERLAALELQYRVMAASDEDIGPKWSGVVPATAIARPRDPEVPTAPQIDRAPRR